MSYRVGRKKADAIERCRATGYGAKVEAVNRDRIIRRDNATCYMCLRKLGKRDIHLDHVVPLERGGDHTEANLKVACRPCNLRKSNRLPEECGWLKHSTGELVIRKTERKK